MNRAPSYDDRVHSIADLIHEGSAKMIPMARDYVNGGSMDLQTVSDNRAAFDRFRLRPRIMIDVTKVDPSTVCFGRRVTFPLGIGPAAGHGLAHPDGEVATARAVAAKGINMGLSTWANHSIEDVAAAGQNAGTFYGMQLSAVKDAETNLNIIRRAEAAGFKAVLISVDCPWLGRRLNEHKNGFYYPPHLKWPNVPHISGGNLNSDDPRSQYETNLQWEHVKWFKQHTKMQIWLKGILTGEDANLAVAAGADGIICSNHGGRQLDGVCASMDALGDVVDAVRGRIPVHVDGGIRRGSDIFKALALGADYVWVGRMPFWGLAYKGEAGVKLALDILYDEFILCMALMGCRDVKEIKRSHLALMGHDGKYRPLADAPTRVQQETVAHQDEFAVKL
ncbi:unnamed protein product [Parajaminaea phylloscopi]